MSIRKIRANTAAVEGDYVRVEQYSQKPLGLFIGFIFGIMIVITITLLNLNLDFLSACIILLTISFIGTMTASGRVTRDIPEVDVVEIKHYPDQDRVTVVIDDERTKRKQAVAVKA